MTVVPDQKIAKDVTKLPYHFPSFPLVKYCKLSAEYHFWKALRMLEDAAEQNGKVMVPASCLNWRRKRLLHDRLIMVYRRSFYQLRLDELKEQELQSYLDMVREIEDENESLREPRRSALAAK